MKAKFTHVMNDDTTGITFIYFDCGTVQSLHKFPDIEYHDQFCIHMDENDTKKLIAALIDEPRDLVCFNKAEMEIIREMLRSEASHNRPGEDILYSVEDCTRRPESMTQDEWKAFLEKLQ